MEYSKCFMLSGIDVDCWDEVSAAKFSDVVEDMAKLCKEDLRNCVEEYTA
jgi:hypothetical protein